MRKLKKFAFFLATVLIVISIIFFLKKDVFLRTIQAKSEKAYEPNFLSTKSSTKTLPVTSKEKEFQVFTNDVFNKSFDIYEEAVTFASQNEYSAIKQIGNSSFVWDNFPPYTVFVDNYNYKEFYSYKEAVSFAKNQEKSYIYYRKDNNLIWSKSDILKKESLIKNITNISQLPELPRGCEVTSLAMLLSFKSVKVDKLTLAKELKKDDSIYKKQDGKVYFGNPNKGFVGDMYSFKENGLGVYHKPIYELLLEYLPKSSIDITGCEFSEVLGFINNKIPVWVIINSTYDKLQEASFIKWQTSDGEIKVTYKEHSVIITGYDEDNIYFNDPLGIKNFAKKEKFNEAWVQMGSQAITFTY